MSVLGKLASALERGDEAPNIALAKEIAAQGDRAAVRELVEHLDDADKAISSDCIKVLYEVGGLQPGLIADYVDAFIRLLKSRNNRLVWGAMTALGAIADLKAAEIGREAEAIIAATEQGSAITQDWGIRVLATVCAQEKDDRGRSFAYLIDFLGRCPAKDIPRHAESALVAVNTKNRDAMLGVLEARRGILKAAQAKRVEGVIRKIRAL